MKVFIIEEPEFLDLTKKIDKLTNMVEALTRIINADNRLYNIKEAAKELHIARQTLSNYIGLGLIEPLLIGNTSYFTREIVDNFLKQKK